MVTDFDNILNLEGFQLEQVQHYTTGYLFNPSKWDSF